MEPAGRNTAAAMAGTALIPLIEPSDLLLFLPSDHFVPDIGAFIATIQSGVAAAQSGYIVTFGVQPSFPSAAYGYIQQGGELDDLTTPASSTYAVERFIEKPTLAKAQEMLLSGKYLWNAGIFLCQASILIDGLSKHAPDILKSCQEAMKASVADGDFIRPDKESFFNLSFRVY